MLWRPVASAGLAVAQPGGDRRRWPRGWSGRSSSARAGSSCPGPAHARRPRSSAGLRSHPRRCVRHAGSTACPPMSTVTETTVPMPTIVQSSVPRAEHRVAEPRHDAGHGVQRVEEPGLPLHLAGRVHDRAHEHPDLHHERHGVADVAVAHVDGRQPDAERRGRRAPRGTGTGAPAGTPRSAGSE